MKNKLLKQYILDRLQEASTYRGLILIATVYGASLDPEETEAIITFGLGISGLISIVFADK